MDKNTLVFIALLSVLFIGQLLLNEGFADTTFSSNPQARTHRIYAIALSMLKDVVYNPMMQYTINYPCLYNGSAWLALIQGPGSSLGVPSPTNPKWKAQPISSLTGIYSSLPEYADFSSIFNDAALESAFRGMQGSDLTPVYSAIVNALMYKPTHMYSWNTMCIHNGNMWSPSPSVREYQVASTEGMPVVSGSALGLPSGQNSNWMLTNPPSNIDPVLLQIIRNTGDGSSAAGAGASAAGASAAGASAAGASAAGASSAPASATSVTLNTESYEYYETTLLSSSGNEQYDTPNKYYESEAGIFYNGYLWSASKAGTMSSLGVPSDTNSNWKKMSIDEFVQIVTRQQGSNPKQLILDPTYIAALKQMTGFNYTPVYNAIINILKYNPSRMYLLTSLCIYDGKIWSPTLGNGTSGSSLGMPSQTNSNWKIYTGSSFAGTLLDKLIKDTAGSASNQMPYQGIEGTNITGPYGAPIDPQFLASLKSEIMNDVRDSLSPSNVMTDSCIDNLLNDQGADFLRYIGKNPAAYIRKDSIPCYGCSVP